MTAASSPTGWLILGGALGVGITVGLLVARAKVRASLGAAPEPNLQPVGPVSALRVGTVVLVDVVKAQLLFVPSPTIPAAVDQVPTDDKSVHVALVAVGAPPGTAPFFTGAIPSSSIIRVLAEPPPGAQA